MIASPILTAALLGLLQSKPAGSEASPGASPTETAKPGETRSERAELRRAEAIEARIDAGDLEQAERLLDSPDFSPLVRATLQGRLALAAGKPSTAERHFRAAMKLAPDHAPLRLLAAHAALAADHPKAVLTLVEHPGLSPSDPAVALLAAAAHEALQRPERAYAALHRAARGESEHLGVRRELVMLCARHDMLAAAQQWAESITPAQLGGDVALVVLAQLAADRRSLTFARWLAAGFPDDADIQGQLARIAATAGDRRAAARAYEHAVRLGADLAHAAAEHYRVTGNHRSALTMNARVTDATRREPQRFDILFEAGKMARAIATGEPLAESGSLSARRRYNLAYAHYALRQFAQATAHARALTETEEADRARALLAAMGR